MNTAVVTDGRYRTSIAAVRALGGAGYRVVVTQTRGETSAAPASFASRFAAEGRWIDGSCRDGAYGGRLLALLEEYDRPVLFCTGADTLNMVSRRREEFAQAADFLIAPPDVLDALNDKEAVHCRAAELGIPVPAEFNGPPDRFPVVIKPHCGEKFGLKASQRYAIANNDREFEEKYALMRRCDDAPIVQEKVDGPGEGVSLLLDRDSRLICAICHRRLREYPAAGGPSTCCVSFYSKEMIDQAYRLLSSFGFVGMAMVEFKGGRVLEVNPRVWGSFPMTACANSPFTARYAQAARGGQVEYVPMDYTACVRMRFTLNDGAAMLDYLRHGKVRPFLEGMADWFRAREALSDKSDPAPLRRYLRNTLLRR